MASHTFREWKGKATPTKAKNSWRQTTSRDIEERKTQANKKERLIKLLALVSLTTLMAKRATVSVAHNLRPLWITVRASLPDYGALVVPKFAARSKAQPFLIIAQHKGTT
jgi:hypothetical protein